MRSVVLYAMIREMNEADLGDHVVLGRRAPSELLPTMA
jgi:hypothetical protein